MAIVDCIDGRPLAMIRLLVVDDGIQTLIYLEEDEYDGICFPGADVSFCLAIYFSLPDSLALVPSNPLVTQC